MIEVDWSRPRSGCKTPGCPHPTYHICFFGQEPEVEFKREVFVREVRRKRKQARPYENSKLTPQQIEAIRRENIGVAQRARWDKYRAETARRDAKVVHMYREDKKSMQTISAELKISRGKVLKILREAQERGEVRIRPKGGQFAFKELV